MVLSKKKIQIFVDKASESRCKATIFDFSCHAYQPLFSPRSIGTELCH